MGGGGGGGREKMAWLRSRPAASTKHTRVPIWYKAHMRLCSHEGEKTGPCAADYAPGLQCTASARYTRIPIGPVAPPHASSCEGRACCPCQPATRPYCSHSCCLARAFKEKWTNTRFRLQRRGLPHHLPVYHGGWACMSNAPLLGIAHEYRKCPGQPSS